MVQAISERLQARRRWVTAAGTRVAFQGSLVVIGDEHVILTAGERAVLVGGAPADHWLAWRTTSMSEAVRLIALFNGCKMHHFQGAL